METQPQNNQPKAPTAEPFTIGNERSEGTNTPNQITFSITEEGIRAKVETLLRQHSYKGVPLANYKNKEVLKILLNEFVKHNPRK